MVDQTTAERVWEWLLTERPQGRGARNFKAQQVSPSSSPDDVPTHDELWRLAAAGVVRVYDPNYAVTDFGERLLTGSTSSLITGGSAFANLVRSAAPNLDPDASSYFDLAIECVPIVMPAALALIRVACELETDSLIGVLITHSPPKDPSKLRNRNLAVRMAALLDQLEAQTLLSKDSTRELAASMEICRSSGNRVLHPPPAASSWEPDLHRVTASASAFRDIAATSSAIKDVLGVLSPNTSS